MSTHCRQAQLILRATDAFSRPPKSSSPCSVKNTALVRLAESRARSERAGLRASVSAICSTDAMVVTGGGGASDKGELVLTIVWVTLRSPTADSLHYVEATK